MMTEIELYSLPDGSPIIRKEENEECISKVAQTITEARTLIEAGFEYVCEIQDTKLFRKRK